MAQETNGKIVTRSGQHISPEDRMARVEACRMALSADGVKSMTELLQKIREGAAPESGLPVILRTIRSMAGLYITWEMQREQERAELQTFRANVLKAIQEQNSILKTLDQKLEAVIQGGAAGQEDTSKLVLSMLEDLQRRLVPLEEAAATR